MMDSKRKLAELAIINARSALENGNKPDAKTWAEQAGQLAPEMEDPWLVLAYLAEPTEGLKYLERVLTLNPASNRARKGIHFLIKKIRDQKQPIPCGYEKYTESESISSQPTEKTSGDDQIQRIENPVPIKEQSRDNSSEEESQKSDAFGKTIDSSEVTAEVTSGEKQVKSLVDNHIAENTEIRSIPVSESISSSEINVEYRTPITFSRKQPSNNQGVDLVSIFISLFGLLILSITILVILYANHLLPFIK